MYLNGYEIAAMVCASLTLVFIVVGLFTDYFEVGRIATRIATIICLILTMILCIAGTVQTENETRSVIEENYKDCVFAENNKFFCNDKIYEYELSKDRNKVNVMSQEDKNQKVVTYKLENNYIRIGKAPAGDNNMYIKILTLLLVFFCTIFLIKFVRNSKDVVLWGFLGCLCCMLSIFFER